MKKLLFVLLFPVTAFAQVNGDLSTQYYENLSSHPNPGISVVPDLTYHLDRDTTLTGLIPYRSTVGWEDADLSLNHVLGKHTQIYFETYWPTSLASQADAMYLGGSGNLRLLTDLGPVNVKFENGLLGWYYGYETKVSGEYNPAFALSDKITLGVKLVSTLKFVTTFHLYTFQDFNGQTSNIYRESVGFTYQPKPVISFDVFASYKNGKLDDIVDLQGGHYQIHAGTTLHF